MSFRVKFGVFLFFAIGLVVLFFVASALISSEGRDSFENLFFSEERKSMPTEKDISGNISVKSFPVNGRLLWVVEMRADNNSFEPPALVVNEGDVVDLSLMAIDRDYELYFPHLGIYKLVPKGEKSKIQFQAYPAGEHSFGCKSECANPPHGILVVNG